MSKKAILKDKPHQGRFQKGTSGNPKGRPLNRKAETSDSVFDVIVNQSLTVTHNGVSREVSMHEALQHTTYQKAIAGNRAAVRQVLKMIEKREKARTAKNKCLPTPSPKTFKTYDPSNADEAMKILNIAALDQRWADEPREDRDRLLLEPWATQLAISRRRGGTILTSWDVSEIKRCTRDSETLKWPRDRNR